jgi:predicted CXXCH cytochrome family protein
MHIILLSLIFWLQTGGQGAAGYVGSQACLPCHSQSQPDMTATWQASRHHQSLTKVDLASLRPLSPPEELSQAVYTLEGFKRQAFWDADYQLLPWEWLSDDEEWQAVESSDDAECLGCHATGFTAGTGGYTEIGVGCEACHGPGAAHVENGGAVDAIVNPGNLSAERRRMVCGQCHSVGHDVSGRHAFPVTDGTTPFLPGEDLTEHFQDSQPLTLGKNRQYSLLIQSPPYFATSGCADCHLPHGHAKNPRMLKDTTGQLCLQCHGKKMRNPELHWPGSDTVPCWGCHQYAHTH